MHNFSKLLLCGLLVTYPGADATKDLRESKQRNNERVNLSSSQRYCPGIWPSAK